ncbi:hypothetical protein LJR129_004947 [Acidovorax sp. LjRoot129]
MSPKPQRNQNRSPEAVAARAVHLLDALPLECDGLTRSLSHLLMREGIEHVIHIGSLEVGGVGHITLHWWIELPTGQICDARARMWLGDDPRVPHGVFEPRDGLRYVSKAVKSFDYSPVIFWAITEKPIEEFNLHAD